jgi:phosphatidylglycerol---prolipoprotein diacylglyceryl transferase
MNRVLFSIGSFNIYWYSFLILLAVVIGSFIAVKYAKNKTTGQTFITDLIFILIPTSIIGARIYYVIFNFDVYKNDLLSIFKIWEGGLAIYGAVIAAILAPSLILGQAIGRWGNFFNMEAYGPKTSLTFLHSLHLPQFIIDGMYIDGSYYQPMFLYESIWCLIGFIILMLIRKRSKTDGTQVSFYFLWYGLGRIVIESFRTDSLYFFCFKVSQIVSLILIIIGLVGLILNKVNINKTISGEVRNNNDRI